MTAIRRTNSTSPNGPRQRTQMASISTRPAPLRRQHELGLRIGARLERAARDLAGLGLRRRSHSKLKCAVRRTLPWAIVAVIAPVSPICKLSGEVIRRTSRRGGNAAAASPAITTSITSPYASGNSQSAGF